MYITFQIQALGQNTTSQFVFKGAELLAKNNAASSAGA
jgi:hypothetical protein